VPRLIVPSPPTPNGPLHLGHLAGPYLLADVLRRFSLARGVPAQVVCLLDDHQSYIADRALVEGGRPDELAARFGDEIGRSLAAFGAEPDARISSSRDPAYQAAVCERFERLRGEGKLELRDGDVLWCEACDHSLYDAYVTGGCPVCGTPSWGGFCEACNAAFDSAELTSPRCDHCERPAVRRRAERLVFPIRPYAVALADYHGRTRLSPKLRALAARWLDLDRSPHVTQLGTWGLRVDGLDGQILSPWFEVALAGPYLRERFAPGGEVTCAFGYDNAYLYLVLDPAVALALGAAPAAELCANEFLMLDGAKMSTSRNRALAADAVLSRVPADLVRLYLAKVRPEGAPSHVSVPVAQAFLVAVTRVWQAWLARLGAMVAAEASGRAPAAAVPTHEQAQFLEQVTGFIERARRGYGAGSLVEASGAVHDLVERAVAFGSAQANLAGIPGLAAQRATGLAVELAAALALARIAAPIMPGFAAQLARCLGESDLAWPEGVDPLPEGRPVALAGVQFFPAEISFGGG
jgi:methionyl-tRNA synthetase